MSKPHGKSKEDLARMKMSDLLQLVKNHNLAKHIHLYRRMKKAELVQSLAKYKSSVPSSAASSRTVTIGLKAASSPQKLVTAAAPRVRKPAPVAKKGKKVVKTTAKSSKGRRNPSLYTKAEGGVAGGALADFERVYGKMDSPKKASPKQTQGPPVLGKRERRKPKKYVPK